MNHCDSLRPSSCIAEQLQPQVPAEAVQFRFVRSTAVNATDVGWTPVGWTPELKHAAILSGPPERHCVKREVRREVFRLTDRFWIPQFDRFVLPRIGVVCCFPCQDYWQQAVLQSMSPEKDWQHIMSVHGGCRMSVDSQFAKVA